MQCASALGSASRLNGREAAHNGRASRRSGLAPLELVLSLVFLLVMMALIINFGSISAWHVRGKMAARYAVARTLSIRTGGNDPMPSNWWAPATMGLSAPMSFNTLPYDVVGQTWNQGDLTQAALRGPAVVDPASGNTIPMNDKRYLEMVDRVQIGSAYLQKTMPLLPKLRRAQINPLQPVFDNLWTYGEMGLGYNGRRMKGWYKVEADQLGNGNLMNLFMAYQMADQKVQQNSGAQALLVLDRDNELLGPPDEYLIAASAAGLLGAGACDASPEDVAQNWIQNPNGLISRIQGRNGGGRGGVPESLARAFLQLYQSQNPPPKAAIQQIQEFLGQLN